MEAKNIFSDLETFFSYVYRSSKILFIFTSFLFFIGYASVSSGFYDFLFFRLFLYLYTLFVASFVFFLASSVLHFGYKKLPLPILVIFSILPLALGPVFLFPIY